MQAVAPSSPPHAAWTSAFPATLGALGLASAMGIGRFAFTPLLPLMQQASGLSIAQGSWLASANYVGYLVGALGGLAFAQRGALAARIGLATVAFATLAMGFVDAYAVWLILRALAGFASAFVLVGMAPWALTRLMRDGRPQRAGAVFAGVGLGIVFAGLIGLAAGTSHWSPAFTWRLFGAASALVAIAGWAALRDDDAPPPVSAAAARRVRFGVDAWMLIACYGVFGLGYILPATFLPALGRQLFPDPAVFGWAWPVFGLAAALSTLAASAWLVSVGARRMFAAGLLVAAAGVAAPALSPGLATLIASALCVGGSFMVATMAAFQLARECVPAGAPSGSARVVAAMTAAFALGQLLGPLTVHANVPGGAGGSLAATLVVPSLAAAGLLIAAALAMLARGRRSLL